jgi:hypothetical protein
MISATTTTIIIKPVHIPALKIPPTTSQELKEMANAKRNVSNQALFCFIFRSLPQHYAKTIPRL